MRLPDYRYEEIKEIAVQMFVATGYDSIPVDSLELARRFGIEVVAYSELGVAGKEAAEKFSSDGFKITTEDEYGIESSTIYFNDEKPRTRARFTVLHELGHILLGHEQESDVAEAEANFFAKFAIAPPSLVDVLDPMDYLQIADVFDLSDQCAFNSWRYYRSWIDARDSHEYEALLEELFVVEDPIGGEPMLNRRRRS